MLAPSLTHNQNFHSALKSLRFRSSDPKPYNSWGAGKAVVGWEMTNDEKQMTKEIQKM
jgi:hypothetical protein